MTKNTMPKTMRLPRGGKLWTRKDHGVPGYSADDGNYDILLGEGYVVLVAFEHDPLHDDNSEFWRKRFPTAREAMEYAEKM